MGVRGIKQRPNVRLYILYLLLVGDGLEGVLLEAEVPAQQQRAQSYELLVRLLAPAPATWRQ